MQSLGEEETPFRQSKHETLFKNVANVTLRGTTFNAQHMDRFLNSNYGERTYQSVMESAGKNSQNDNKMTQRTVGPGGGGGSNLISYLSSSSQIRPSYSFMGLSREEQK